MAYINRTYTLTTDTLAAGDAGVDIFESGITDLEIKFDGIAGSSYHYLNFVVDYGDGSDYVIIQNSDSIYGSQTDVAELSSKTLNHIFYPSDRYLTNYTVGISGIRTDLTIDTYKVNVIIGKQSVCAYRDMKIINSYLYTSPAGINNLMLTVEMQNPRFVGSIIVPQEKVLSVYAPLVEPAIGLDVGIFLRTEIYTQAAGNPIGLQTIITEKGSIKLGSSHIVVEGEAPIIVIGTETGEEVIINIDDSMRMLNINGDEVNPIMILIPEYSDSAFNSDFEDANVVIEGLEYH
jgi:hypothetical protein